MHAHVTPQKSFHSAAMPPLYQSPLPFVFLASVFPRHEAVYIAIVSTILQQTIPLSLFSRENTTISNTATTVNQFELF